MKQSIGFCQFCDAFRNMNRNEQFSYDGKSALFDYLEEYEQSTMEEIELDVIAICCEFTEYENLEEFQNDYGSGNYQNMEDINNNTIVIPIEGKDSFIIQQF